MKIQSITCPSCGSSISANESESRVTCEFCGTTVIVEDTRQEGYNLEMGAIKARANASDELADVIKALTSPLCDYSRVSSDKVQLERQYKSLERQVSICKKSGRVIAYLGGSLVTIFLLLIAVLTKAPIPVFLVLGLVSCLMFPICAMLVLKYWDNVIKGSNDTKEAVEAHAKTLERFDSVIASHTDISIPEMYRNHRAMEFIEKKIRSQEAHTVDHAISLYDDLLRQEKAIALQEEQIKLQKQQIEEARKMQMGGAPVKSVTRGSKQVVVVRQQGHSIILHLLLCVFCGIGFITIPYYTISKKHYWHL